ncbi:MAG TPA: SDR family oxidoreductase [Bacteroidota bacterium]|jgi:dihydroflavonol-4-reductase|nr:SDR family oxidoreductase [Bacteroidota bacterium]
MNRILVTGATGCIGSNLIIALLEAGCQVRAFHRNSSDLRALQDVAVERITGDIRDIDSLRSAMRGCDTVFHTAALVSFWKRRKQEQLEVNVNGTRNVVNACLELGIETLVHTSSVAALGYRADGGLIDETTPFNWDPRITYKYSKHLAELEVLRGAEGGLRALLVNPTVVIGPRDVYIHGGQIVRDTKLRRIPIYIKGGMNVVSVHDVVNGHIAAARLGRSGERYILGGVNLSHREVFEHAARVLKVQPPRIKAPVPVVQSIAKICDLFGELTHMQPWITSDLISGIGKFNWYSIDKAKQELAYTTSSIDAAIQETYEWYLNNNML